MRKFLVNVQFFGKNYSGFQINEGKKTIQSEIEIALKSCLKLISKLMAVQELIAE